MINVRSAENNMHALVIVETRNINNIENIIKGHLKKLNNDWKLIIFHGTNNFHLFKDLDAIKHNLGTNFSIDQYNKLLSSAGFWFKIPYEKVLIFQHDSMLLRRGIESFLPWDYVGAPWPNPPNGGNGGLSLRSKSVMLKVIAKHKCDTNEDVYFSRHVPEFGKLAPRYICEQFSCEMLFKLGTLGYHAINRHLTTQQCNLIKTQYPKHISLL